MDIMHSYKIVIKTLDFIDDKDLQVIIENRLAEIEKNFLINAYLSTIVLSISCIEGIFKHVARVFKTEIESSSLYPVNKKGKKLSLEQLTIEKMYQLLLEKKILEEVTNFEQVYTLFRNYRNFIHPEKQKEEAWPVGLGQSQMALGLLNATIDQMSKYLFIGTEILVIESGRPRYDLSKVLHLDTVANIRTHSFLIFKKKVSSFIDISLGVELSRNSIFNFVFNYVDEANFKMIRLDNREIKRTPNSLLHTKQKYDWRIIAEADEKKPPDGVLNVRIIIDVENDIFTFLVNGEEYIFIDKKGNHIELLREFEKDLRIGWFNEEGPVKLRSIQIKH